MTTLDARRDRKRSFLSIYKPGQGKWVRWGTVAGMAIVVLCGTGWLTIKELAANEPWVKAVVGGTWTLAGVILTWWMVNSPKLAEFMIMTESEMRKVTWPSRKEVFASTKIVILLTVLIGVLLYLVDVAFLSFFKYIGVA